ncbi:hypothetical protein CAPTEDRAFT_214161 [Capitella teleta]|uniref:SUEL-type lectin domain-containing protein n=1 Tax=Capitella teleta TaxID=283909 RepID=R7TK71_CAPTE|nr:hypothetical protein CAPTEDRAFT_214161 [Capitella teleta]|eukprot:ELT94218.1 hypothetical protein CAPTEDRAFT_214161 [Capitella teleta]
MSSLRLVLLWMSAFYQVLGSELKEFCQNEKFTAKCGKDQVISITKAMYGRMSFSRCVERDYGYVGCEDDVRHVSDKQCSGRHECEIGIPNSFFDALKPCPGDLKAYFAVEYKCLPVFTMPMSQQRRQCTSPGHVTLAASSGSLASVVTMATQLGSPDCPYVIRGHPGQKINITLVDFTTDAGKVSCQVAYAVVSERAPARSETICSGWERERLVYTSQSSSVTIRMNVNSRQSTNSHFMLQYQIYGCPNPDIPPQAKLTRTGDHAEITCSDTGRVYHLECDGEKWMGDFDNCTLRGAGGRVDEVRLGIASLPFGEEIFLALIQSYLILPGASLVVIVVIAIALGVVILLAGLLIIRWKQRLSAPPLPNAYHPSGFKDSSNLPRAYMPASQIEQDSLYQQSTENEYAYISDCVPSTAPGVRHIEMHTPVRKCSDYGTTYAHSGGHVGPVQTKSAAENRSIATTCYFGDHIPRYVDNIESPPLQPRAQPPLPQPPDYFVLDPEEKRRRLELAQQSSGCPSTNDNPVTKRMNQSIHEFTSYVSCIIFVIRDINLRYFQQTKKLFEEGSCGSVHSSMIADGGSGSVT